MGSYAVLLICFVFAPAAFGDRSFGSQRQQRGREDDHADNDLFGFGVDDDTVPEIPLEPSPSLAANASVSAAPSTAMVPSTAANTSVPTVYASPSVKAMNDTITPLPSWAPVQSNATAPTASVSGSAHPHGGAGSGESDDESGTDPHDAQPSSAAPSPSLVPATPNATASPNGTTSTSPAPHPTPSAAPAAPSPAVPPAAGSGSGKEHPHVPQVDPEEAAGHQALIFMGVFICLAILAVGFLMVHALKQNGIEWMPESMVFFAIGLLLSLAVLLDSSRSLSRIVVELNTSFSETFFLLLLPPIIYESGFSMDVRSFFANFTAIGLYAFLGTALSTVSVAAIVYLSARFGLFYEETQLLDASLFGAIISATDPVAVLATFNALGADKTLYSLVFGESVLNDAVAIVLYHTLLQFSSPGVDVTWRAVGVGALFFLVTFLGSVVIGVGVGVCAALLFKHVPMRGSEASLERAVLVLVPFVSYMLAEGLQLSGVVAILFTGMTMAHYTQHNVSKQSRRFSLQLFCLLAEVCESLVFVYIGVAAPSLFSRASALNKLGEWGSVLVAVLACLAGRAANVYACTPLANRARSRRQQIDPPVPFVLWFSGLRGGVAFALSSEARKSLPSRKVGAVLESVTLSVVVISMLSIGSTISPLLRHFGLAGNGAGAGGQAAVHAVGSKPPEEVLRDGAQSDADAGAVSGLRWSRARTEGQGGSTGGLAGGVRSSACGQLCCRACAGAWGCVSSAQRVGMSAVLAVLRWATVEGAGNGNGRGRRGPVYQRLQSGGSQRGGTRPDGGAAFPAMQAVLPHGAGVVDAAGGLADRRERRCGGIPPTDSELEFGASTGMDPESDGYDDTGAEGTIGSTASGSGKRRVVRTGGAAPSTPSGPGMSHMSINVGRHAPGIALDGGTRRDADVDPLEEGSGEEAALHGGDSASAVLQVGRSSGGSRRGGRSATRAQRSKAAAHENGHSTPSSASTRARAQPRDDLDGTGHGPSARRAPRSKPVGRGSFTVGEALAAAEERRRTRVARADARLEAVAEAEGTVARALRGQGTQKEARQAVELLVQRRVAAGLPASDGSLVQAAIADGVVGATGVRRVAALARGASHGGAGGSTGTAVAGTSASNGSGRGPPGSSTGSAMRTPTTGPEPPLSGADGSGLAHGAGVEEGDLEEGDLEEGGLDEGDLGRDLSGIFGRQGVGAVPSLTQLQRAFTAIDNRVITPLLTGGGGAAGGRSMSRIGLEVGATTAAEEEEQEEQEQEEEEEAEERQDVERQGG